MGYKVRVSGTGTHPLKRDYGTGAEGKSGNYKTRDGAEARAKLLKRKFSGKQFSVKVVRVSS